MPMTATRPHAIGEPGYTSYLPCEPSSVRSARQLVSNAFGTWGIDEDLTGVGELIVSELMTNTIAHTGCRRARVVVRRLSDTLVRIGVADRDRGLPAMGNKPSDDAVGGRGLLLVEELSDRWGYDRLRQGKVVWAELQVPAHT